MVKMVVVATALAGCLVVRAEGDSLSQIGNVRLKGFLGARLDKMIENHVAAADIDYLTAPFLEKTERKFWWQTEFWGKWMHSSVPYLKYAESAKLRASIDRSVDILLSSQEANGYIGNYPDELRCGEGWDVWGMKYTLMGLLHYFDLVKDTAKGKDDVRCERVLSAAKRLCDYVIGEIGPNGKRGRELWQTGNWTGFASSSILEPVMWLYRRTSEKRYLDFATYIVRGMTEPDAGPRLLDLALRGISVADRNGHGNKPNADGHYVTKDNRWKAYEMMSCYQGLIEYWEVMRESPLVFRGEKAARLLEAAVATGEQIVRDEINLAGGCACQEAWFHGAKKQHLPYAHLQETCVTTTWMRFCEKLLDVTGDPKWADQLERTFYNAYLAALNPAGSDFAAYTPLNGYRSSGMHHCYMHINCCSANGPRGFLCFLKEFFRVKDGAAVFNFYGSALVSDTLPGTDKRVAFDMYSLYPRADEVRIVSHTEGVGTLPLKLRIPAWAAGTTVTLNGKACDGVRAGAYYVLSREWRLGDIVEVRFAQPVVAHTLCDGTARTPHAVAFTRGPILLARDSRLDGPGALNEPYPMRSFTDGKVIAGFSVLRPSCDDFWMTFAAPLKFGSHTENPEGRLEDAAFFCDYASAGNAWSRDNHYRTWFLMEYGPHE